MDNSKKTKLKKLEAGPIWEELATWFYSHRVTEVLSQEDIATKIQSIKNQRNQSCRIIPYHEYANLINKCREFLEEKYKVSLIAVRAGGKRYCGYKLTNDAEGTYLGVRTGKQIMDGMKRFRRRLPMIKREHIWPSMRQVFGEAKDQIVAFRSLADKFVGTYEEAKQIEAKEEKKD